jgi:uncharacterized protein (DUF924 family)
LAVKAVDEIERVLDFWFGACGPDGALDPVKRKMLFGDGWQYDGEIRRSFGALHGRAAGGGLEKEWSATPRGMIALIVVLDQFSRHIHRGAAGAFAQDPAAQRLAVAGIDQRLDRELIPAQRAFFYLPLEHAEDLELQRLCVRCYDGLAHAVADAWRADYESFLDYARRHRDIIERFGRFPHRNAILRRDSTPPEREFLKQPGSTF